MLQKTLRLSLAAAILASTALVGGCPGAGTSTSSGCGYLSTGDNLRPPSWIIGSWSSESGSVTWTFRSDEISTTEVSSSTISGNFSEQKSSGCQYQLTLGESMQFFFEQKSSSTLEYYSVSNGEKQGTSRVLTKSGASD